MSKLAQDGGLSQAAHPRESPMIVRRVILAAALSLAAMPACAMTLKSSDVTEGVYFPVAEICARYGGSDVSPALSWSGAPQGTKSFAVTMFDPDAQGDGWWHWLVVNIPANANGLAQGAGRGALPEGAVTLQNSSGNARYDGPCPPKGSGLHHYQITLWALGDASVPLDPAGEPAAAGDWLQKHSIGMTRITPVYAK
jgi:Raf kinase inhibitor-like YbhB/YbcL family protein